MTGLFARIEDPRSLVNCTIVMIASFHVCSYDGRVFSALSGSQDVGTQKSTNLIQLAPQPAIPHFQDVRCGQTQTKEK